MKYFTYADWLKCHFKFSFDWIYDPVEGDFLPYCTYFPDLAPGKLMSHSDIFLLGCSVMSVSHDGEENLYGTLLRPKRPV